MEDEALLLDTPKKSSLQRQSTDLRGILKEFERKFTAENGRKPKQADIKTDITIAEKYKEYHKIQDVLGGKLSFEKYSSAGATTKARTRRHTKTDSGTGSSPQTQNQILFATPRKQKGLYESVPFEQQLKSPDSCLLNTIGPTPHRDGKVLGLFDLMPGSGSTEGIHDTPTSSARKRKIEELYQDTPAKRSALQIIQTPGRLNKKQGDVLDFLAGTPQKSLELSTKRHSRTPQSEGRKFELSQFFATPSAQRFLFSNHDSASKQQASQSIPDTEQTPQRQPNTTRPDVTPSYLRRSTSFKDRLLSATRGSATSDSMPSLKQAGPPTLRHFRSSTSGIFRVKDIQQPKPTYEEDDNDDDLEALRELEDDDYEHQTIIKDSQLDLERALSPEPDGENPQPMKEYKKKGQKRTTKKANIKPVTQKPTVQPKFVAADDSEFDEDCEVTDDELDAASKQPVENEKSGKEGTSSKTKRKAGTINPNAQSHQNFRSLKIKNKISKAKGPGKSRFSRARRQ